MTLFFIMNYDKDALNCLCSVIMIVLIVVIFYLPYTFLRKFRKTNFVDILIGLQNGDEGKGKVTFDLLTKHNYNLCVRFNGGPNAGHTIYYGKDKIKVALHQLPMGVLLGIPSIIGPGCVVNFEKLQDEITDVVYRTGIDRQYIYNNLFIAYNAHEITPDALQDDSTGGQIGTTKNGIGQTYSKKYARTGKRVSSIPESGYVIWTEENNMPEKSGLHFIDMYEYIQHLKESGNYRVLFEGAQGYELDIDHGDYPYVTSSPCLSYYALSNGCFTFSDVRHVFGCSKIYETYVGTKNFQPEGMNFEKLALMGDEVGATTGRRRQCNFLNLEKLIRSINMNGATMIVMNKCDIFDDFAKDQNNSFTLYINTNKAISFTSLKDMLRHITKSLYHSCPTVKYITYSNSPYEI